MFTYQDWNEAADKAAFIVDVVQEYRGSDTYMRAAEAQAYDRRNNAAVVNRMTFLERYGIQDSKVKFFHMRNGFFPKMVRQHVQYLLGNGVTFPDEIKNRLGSKFDRDLQRAGQQAKVDGVVWGFWNLDRLMIFRATEFAPIYDESNGDLMVGIRFWQIDSEKPMYYEVFTQEGITKYKQENDGLAVAVDEKPTPYILHVQTDMADERVTDTANYSRIPIFPLYANDLMISEFSDGLKEDIDAYDYISSDLVDGIHQVEGVYWVVKNYGGNDLAQLLTEMQAQKAVYFDSGGDSGADGKSLEVPFQAKQIALELLEKKMYSENMALDTRALTGGSLTTVAIRVAFADFDLKTDLFEYQVLSFVQNILELIGITGAEPKFKRRTLTNDTEMVDNISKMLADGYVDEEWAINNNPLIVDEEQDELMKRIALAREEEAEAQFGLPPNDTDAGGEQAGGEA